MNQSGLPLLLIIVLSCCCTAQPAESLVEDFTIPFQLAVSSVPETYSVDLYIVYGDRIDTFERMLIDSFTANPPRLKSVSTVVNGRNETREVSVRIVQVSENEISLSELEYKAQLLVLVGGPAHNNISRDVYARGYVTNESPRFQGQIMVGTGKLPSGTSLMILRHAVRNESAGGKKLEREAVKYSPLRYLVADEYVPVVATGIGMFLMGITNLAKAVLESLAGEVGKKRFSYGHKGRRIWGVSVREVFALFGAALVLGFAVTWTFTGPTSRFFDYILINTVICLVAGLSHDLVHRVLGRLFSIKVEYRFWYAGSFITVLTALLGNSFGMQGFLLEKPDEKISRWKYGVMKLAGPLFSAAVAGIFAALYLNFPSDVYQMIFTTASILALAETMPVKGLDGYDIREWNRPLYALIFFCISALYFTINFMS